MTIDYTSMYKIGQGTYGIVYRASFIDTSGKRIPVALKILKYSKANLRSADYTELKAAQLFDNPYVLRIYKIEIYENTRLCIVSDLCESSLPKLLQLRLSSVQRRALQFGILRGLEYFASVGFVHCDLKPDNILIYKRQLPHEQFAAIPKIIDFGLGTFIKQKMSAFRSPSAAYKWTTGFRPPEVCFGVWDYGFSADIWSAGVVFLLMTMRENIFFSTDNMQFEAFAKAFDTDVAHIYKRVFGDDEYLTLVKHVATHYTNDPLELDLIQQMLELDWRRRPSAKTLLYHAWFRDFDEARSYFTPFEEYGKMEKLFDSVPEVPSAQWL